MNNNLLISFVLVAFICFMCFLGFLSYNKEANNVVLTPNAINAAFCDGSGISSYDDSSLVSQIHITCNNGAKYYVKEDTMSEIISTHQKMSEKEQAETE